MGVGSAALLAWTAARGGLAVVPTMTAAQWGWVLRTGLLLSGYVGTWYAALALAPAVDVTAVLVVGSVITTVLATAVQGAPLAPQLGWVLVILAGGALVAVPMWRSPEAATV